MNNQHPITPPPELVQQWASAFYGTTIAPGEAAIDIATKAAQWGANQELEACVELLSDLGGDGAMVRRYRRPKQPSLKEQALDALREAESSGCLYVNGRGDLIRKALEALPND